MNETVISARDLTKVYRLYTKPHYRFLDMFGLLPDNGRRFTEHVALNRVSLEIPRGQKVAIIGRNGAGKSTLLKMLTRVVEPTSGELTVGGQVHALLQIGTGFHPDFTGRDNVLAYLAQMGVARRRAEQLCKDIVAFAELEEYIDQPVKTYSTGMGVRLMFSTSTALAPDILVLDEVLGVGDAYFAQKSFERIQELCEGAGTTLLLVTHDVYSAMRLCDRFLWLDRGQLVMDGASREVVHAYEQSIRGQEEHRLRLKRIATVESLKKVRPWYGQIQMQGQHPPTGRFMVSGLRLIDRDSGALLAALSIASADGDGTGITVEASPGDGNWGEPTTFEGQFARPFLPHGSIFHRLPLLVSAAAAAPVIRAGKTDVELTFWTDGHADDVPELAVFDEDGKGSYVALLPPPLKAGWHTLRAPLAAGNPSAATSPAGGVVRYGSRALEITGVEFRDANGDEAHIFGVGTTFNAVLKYRVNDDTFDERPTVIVAFHKDGVVRSHRFWTDQVRIAHRSSAEGQLEVTASPLLLGAATYTVTISVFREGYFESAARHRFFSANAEVLDIHSRGYEIVVRPSQNVLCNDVVFQHPATWRLDGAPAPDGQVVIDAE
jgi:lipopolysaccharide transport system ATP-binding protein